MRNNVKALVWEVVSRSDHPITVTDVIRALGDVPNHSVYSAFDSLKAEKMVVQIPSRAGKTYKKSDLAIQKSRALSVLSENTGHGYKRAEVANIIGCHPHRAYMILEELVDEGWINRVGGNKLVYYYYGDALKSAESLVACKACGKETLHKKNGTGRLICSVCGKQRKM